MKPKKNKEITYSGHTWCRKCGHTHWMYGACVDIPPKMKTSRIKQLEVSKENEDNPEHRFALPHATNYIIIKSNFESYVKGGFLTYRVRDNYYEIQAEIKNGKIVNPILIGYYSLTVPIEKVMREVEKQLGLESGSIKTN